MKTQFQSQTRNRTDVSLPCLGWLKPCAWILFLGVLIPGSLLGEGRLVLNELLANSHQARLTGLTNIVDWVELMNVGDAPMELGGVGLSDRDSLRYRWTFPSGVRLEAGSRLAIACSADLPPAVQPGSGVLNTGFSLSSSGGAFFVTDKAARGGATLDSLTYGIQAAEWTLGRQPDGGARWQLCEPTPGGPNRPAALESPRVLRINEWMANPAIGDDYFELFNASSHPVELSGLYLSDDPKKRTKFRIADLSFAGVGDTAYVVFRADRLVDKGADHVNFSLDASGEVLVLSDASGQALDIQVFGPQERGVSQGRFPDGGDQIVSFAENESPNEPNMLPLRGVVINEVLSHADDPLEDAFELYNESSESVDLSGWFVSDNLHKPRKYRIPQGTVIEPGGYSTFYRFQLQPWQGVLPGFSFNSAHGDEFYVFSADASGALTGYRASVTFSAAPNGVPFGRYATALGPQFVYVDYTTFGTPITAASPPELLPLFRTGKGAPNAPPVVGPLVISEIHYHPVIQPTLDPSALEFIEIYNTAVTNVNLFDPDATTNRWQLRGAVQFTFEPGRSIPAKTSVLIVGFDPATNQVQTAEFRRVYTVPQETPLYGPWTGRLSNGSEALELWRPDIPQFWFDPDYGYIPYILADRVAYRDRFPWPSAADGTGASLQRRQDYSFGNDPVNWMATVPTPGRPNLSATQIAIPTVVMSGLSQSVDEGEALVIAPLIENATDLQWRFNGIALTGETNAHLSIAVAKCLDSGQYSLVAGNAFACTQALVTVLVGSAPTITHQPEHQVAPLGGTAVFCVTARGTAPFAYQWTSNGVALSGATGSVLRLEVTDVTWAAQYAAKVSNSRGSVLSRPASLEVALAPSIVSAPTAATVFTGQGIGFAVVAAGLEPLRYQWMKDGVPLPSANRPDYQIPSTTLADAAFYTVEISNDHGTIVSAPVPLSVTDIPMLSLFPAKDTVSRTNRDVVFNLTRTGNLGIPSSVGFALGGSARYGIDYELPPAGLRIAAGTSVTNFIVRLLNPQRHDGNKTLTLTFTNRYFDYAFTSRSNATVVIQDDSPPDPWDSVQPSPSLQLLALGDIASFKVAPKFEASDSGGGSTTFQWEFNGQPISGATQPSLELPVTSFEQAGYYRAQIRHDGLTVWSKPAELRVQPRVQGLQFKGLSVVVTFEATVGRLYSVHVSTNLVQWEPLLRLKTQTALSQFVQDPAPPQMGFYKITQEEDPF